MYVIPYVLIFATIFASDDIDSFCVFENGQSKLAQCSSDKDSSCSSSLLDKLK